MQHLLPLCWADATRCCPDNHAEYANLRFASSRSSLDVCERDEGMRWRCADDALYLRDFVPEQLRESFTLSLGLHNWKGGVRRRWNGRNRFVVHAEGQVLFPKHSPYRAIPRFNGRVEGQQQRGDLAEHRCISGRPTSPFLLLCTGHSTDERLATVFPSLHGMAGPKCSPSSININTRFLV